MKCVGDGVGLSMSLWKGLIGLAVRGVCISEFSVLLSDETHMLLLTFCK